MLGSNIQYIRKQKGISLSECATRASISKSYLSNIERNINQNPSIQIVEKIADVLEVDLSMLLASDNAPLMQSEWLAFIHELKESGIGEDQLQEYKTVIEFAKWQKDNQKSPGDKNEE